MDRTYHHANSTLSNGDMPYVGPHPGHVQVSRVYYSEEEIQAHLQSLRVSEASEVNSRLQGVAFIDQVRKRLMMPVHTFNTAVIWYNRFRLTYSPEEYTFTDAAAAALFVASKIEDTLKKSRDILCAAHNSRISPAEYRTPDDPIFEHHSKLIVGLERITLESASFDFRTRHANELVVKLAKTANFDSSTSGLTAFNCCIDLYRTWAPLKQTRQTMAFACVELAASLNDIDVGEALNYSSAFNYQTLMDLLDLYIQHRGATLNGPRFSDQKFLNIRIALNEEAEKNGFSRYVSSSDRKATSTYPPREATNGTSSSRLRAGSSRAAASPPQVRGAVGERGKDGTVRFLLDREPAEEEKRIVARYFEPPREVEVYEDEMAMRSPPAS